MIIPANELSAELLQLVLEEFVTREGTDYGLEEFSLSEKVDHVREQINNNEVVIVYDQALESVSLMPSHLAKDFACD